MEKFIKIAHRGNVNGPSKWENEPSYITEALNEGFDVEIDVWASDKFSLDKFDGFRLGHDEPKYKISLDFLKTHNVWCHAKNVEALEQLLENGIHCFWHENDERTLTSKGYIWTYPHKLLRKRSICVDLSEYPYFAFAKENCVGICADWLVR